MRSSFTPRSKPPALRPGDTVGIVAPASKIKREALDKGCEALRRQGYRPFYFDSILEHDLYFAGSGERRARELEEMFARDEVKAILCARGGYGANYLLPMLDLKKSKFILRSLSATVTPPPCSRTLPTRRGSQLFTARWWPKIGRMTMAWIWPRGRQRCRGCQPGALGAESGATGLASGTAEGILYGGCLSHACRLLGDAL